MIEGLLKWVIRKLKGTRIKVRFAVCSIVEVL